MTAAEFYDAVVAHPDLEIISTEGTTVLVRHEKTGAVWAVGIELLKEEWELLEALLCGRQDVVVLDYLRRIIGYYSLESNSNLSKLGEFRDRAKGDYKIPEN